MPRTRLPIAADSHGTMPLEPVGALLADAAVQAKATGEPHLFTPAFAKGTPRSVKEQFEEFLHAMDLAAGSKLGVSIAYNTAGGQPQILVMGPGQRLCQGETPMAEWHSWRS